MELALQRSRRSWKSQSVRSYSMYKLNSRTNKSPISSDNQGSTVFSFLTTAKKTRECKVVNSEAAADT